VVHDIDCGFDSQYNCAVFCRISLFVSTKRMGSLPVIPPIDPSTPNEKSPSA
jgi:hypothetical protein